MRQVLQNNELMKKTDSTEEVSGLVVKGQRERSQSGDPKEIQKLLAVLLANFASNCDTEKIV